MQSTPFIVSLPNYKKISLEFTSLLVCFCFQTLKLTNFQTNKLPYLYTSIATSGQTKAQSIHPVQFSGLTIQAGWYPVGLKFLDKPIT
jgi:hypothetical protein